MNIIIDDLYAQRDIRVYTESAPTLRAERYGLKTICAMRGRNKNNPSDRTRKTPDAEWVQRLEPNTQGISNTITTVPKDNILLSSEGDDYRARNLTPREYWRFMGFSDEDYEKAAKVSNQTNLYKQAGNAIVKDVLMALFSELL